MNKSAASAASPDYVKFQIVVKSAASAASRRGGRASGGLDHDLLQVPIRKNRKVRGLAWPSPCLAFAFAIKDVLYSMTSMRLQVEPKRIWDMSCSIINQG